MLLFGHLHKKPISGANKPRAIAFGLFFHIVSIKSTLLLACLRIENIAQQIHYYVRANSLH